MFDSRGQARMHKQFKNLSQVKSFLII